MSPSLRKKYLSHPAARELANYIAANDFLLIIRQKASHPDVFAEFDNVKKRIYVTLRDQNGRFRSHADFLFLLAHETRHLQHWIQGLYTNYYENSPHLVKYFGPGNRHELRLDQACSLLVAVRAERDCDQFARDYLDRHLGKGVKLNPLLRVVYPASEVASYGDYQALISDNMRGVTEAYEKWKKRWIITQDSLKDIPLATEKKSKQPSIKKGLSRRIARLLIDAAAIEGLCGEKSLVRGSIRNDVRQIMSSKKEYGMGHK